MARDCRNAVKDEGRVAEHVFDSFCYSVVGISGGEVFREEIIEASQFRHGRWHLIRRCLPKKQGPTDMCLISALIVGFQEKDFIKCSGKTSSK